MSESATAKEVNESKALIKLKSLLEFSGSAHIRPMNENEMRMMMSESLDHDNSTSLSKPFSVLLEEAHEIRDVFPAKVLAKRLEVFEVNITGGLFMLILSNMDNLAISSMWVDALKLVHRNDARYSEIVTISVLANYFPMGIPTDEAYRECWDGQKGTPHNVDIDNLMDNPHLLDTTIETRGSMPA